MAYVEKALGDSADRHNEEIAEAHAKLDQLRSRLTTCEANSSSIEALKKNHSTFSAEKAKRDAHATSISERLDYLEKLTGDSAEQHSRELVIAQSKIDQMHGRLSTVEKTGSALSDQQRSAEATMADERAALHAHHATLRERLDYIESALGDSADKHNRELENLRADHKRLVMDHKSKETHTVSLGERVSYLEKNIGDSAEQHAQEIAHAHSKIEQMHGRVTAVEAQGAAVENIKKSHASLLQDRAAKDAHHASSAERLDYIERIIGDSADKHAKELKSAVEKLEHHHKRLAKVEGHEAAINDLQRAHQNLDETHKSAWDAHQATLNERVRYLENIMGESSAKHMKEIESLKDTHGRMATDAKARDAHHASVAERLDFVEKLLGDSADKHEKELRAAHSKIDAVHSRVMDGRAMSEDAVRDLLASEKDAREAHRNTIHQRMKDLEQMLGDHVDRSSRELDATKSAHGRFVKDQKTVNEKHASMGERLEYLESVIGDSADKHAQELKNASGKIEQLHGRLQTVEKSHQVVGELQRSHSNLSKDHKAALDAHHSSLNERMDYLESRLGESLDKNSKELEQMRVSHGRMTTDQKARDAHHASVAERLDYLEKAMGDSADKHTQEIQATHLKVEQMNTRVLEAEARGGHIDAIRKSHSNLVNDMVTRDTQHASLNQRVDYVEKLLGDSIERHQKEMQAHRQNHETLHARLHEERQSREQAHSTFETMIAKEREGRGAHHSTFEERLTRCENVIAETQEMTVELKEHCGNEAQLRSQHHATIQDHLTNERRARETHERTVQSHLASERKAREVHEGLVGEKFDHEKAARERHAGHFQELIAREKDARDKHHDTHQDLMARERHTTEARYRELHDIMQKERSFREQHHSNFHDAIHKEKAARVAIEELLASEKAERSKHHETIAERVDSLQKTVGVFDSLIRKELEERSKEYRRIWDAIDNHTHDLSTQIVGDGPEMSVSASAADPPPRMRAVTPPPQMKAISYGAPQTAPIWAMSQAPVVSSAMPMSAAPPVVTSVGYGAPMVRSQSPIRSEPMTYAVAGMSTGGSMTPQAMPPSSPIVGSAEHHHVERIACGHTRYGGQRNATAEIYMD
eukprot:TRINITY_DN2841_c3_g2_i1.p1 TRINITY_DN2841_c3_g2~~TRINITY_DN2841_c3_g2_i1.p1  ORF type:complete len:1158 (+),score=286.19 TRINITY_DN2841_c3_g2_i1:162-3476(+)